MAYFIKENRNEKITEPCEQRLLFLMQNKRPPLRLLASVEAPCRCYIVRHGETTDNANGDAYSGILNPELTKRGIKQAELTGKFLARESIQRIYSSPLKRAAETARRIQSQAGGVLIINDMLREMDYGNWEGLSRNDVKRRWPRLMDAFNTDPIHNLPPNAENLVAVAKRLAKFWEDLKLLVSAERVTSLVVVTHKTAGRLLLASIQGTNIAKYRDKLMDNCSIAKCLIQSGGKVILEYENNTEQLHGP